MGVEGTPHGMGDGDGSEHSLEDGEVGWVGPFGRVVKIREALEVSFECGIV